MCCPLCALPELESCRASEHGWPPAIRRNLSEDLMTSSYAVWGSACQIDTEALRSVMAEVTDPVLQQTTLELCIAVVRADFHRADSEENLVNALAEHWRLVKPGLHFS